MYINIKNTLLVSIALFLVSCSLGSEWHYLGYSEHFQLSENKTSRKTYEIPLFKTINNEYIWISANRTFQLNEDIDTCKGFYNGLNFNIWSDNTTYLNIKESKVIFNNATIGLALLHKWSDNFKVADNLIEIGGIGKSISLKLQKHLNARPPHEAFQHAVRFHLKFSKPIDCNSPYFKIILQFSNGKVNTHTKELFVRPIKHTIYSH